MAEPLRIWLMTVGEPLWPDGPYQRLLRTGNLTEWLAERGHEVVFWTSDFNHVKKAHRVGRSQRFRHPAGFDVVVLHGQGYRSNVSRSRVRDHRQVASAFRRMAARMPVPDVIVASYPTLEFAGAAVGFGHRHGLPVLLDIRDLWPDAYLDLLPDWGPLRGLGRICLSRSFRWARKILAQAHGLIGITDGFLDWGLNKAARPRGRFDGVFPLAYNPQSIPVAAINQAEGFWKTFGIDAQLPIFCFFGYMGRQFDLSTVIEAGRLLQTEVGTGKFQIILGGEGDSEAVYRKAAEGVDSIILPGWVNGAQIQALNRVATAGLAPYQDIKNFTINIPNKIIDYLAAGLPILTSLTGSVRDLVVDNECGAGYTSGDAAGLASLMRGFIDAPEWVQQLSSHARQLFEERFQSDDIFKDYAHHLEATARTCSRMRRKT